MTGTDVFPVLSSKTRFVGNAWVSATTGLVDGFPVAAAGLLTGPRNGASVAVAGLSTNCFEGLSDAAVGLGFFAILNKLVTSAGRWAFLDFGAFGEGVCVLSFFARVPRVRTVGLLFTLEMECWKVSNQLSNPSTARGAGESEDSCFLIAVENASVA